jgi:hypothetical protein
VLLLFKEENMAIDDYDVVVFKILLYYYAIFKGTILFNETEFKRAIKYDSFADGYLERVLKLMSEENLIDEVYVSKAWGNQYMMLNDLSDIEITAEGIHYLKENSGMENVKKYLLDHVEMISALINIVSL